MKKPPLGGFLLIPWKWWSWGESNPRPQALYRKFYMFSYRCFCLTVQSPTSKQFRRESPWFNYWLSDPTNNESLFMTLLWFPTRPRDSSVQRPAGLSS